MKRIKEIIQDWWREGLACLGVACVLFVGISYMTAKATNREAVNPTLVTVTAADGSTEEDDPITLGDDTTVNITTAGTLGTEEISNLSPVAADTLDEAVKRVAPEGHARGVDTGSVTSNDDGSISCTILVDDSDMSLECLWDGKQWSVTQVTAERTTGNGHAYSETCLRVGNPHGIGETLGDEMLGYTVCNTWVNFSESLDDTHESNSAFIDFSETKAQEDGSQTLALHCPLKGDTYETSRFDVTIDTDGNVTIMPAA